MGLRLSKKHGVNPTIPICFWCGEPRNEVALLGAGYKEEAPMHMVIDYEFCEECKSKTAMGVRLIEASKTPVNDHPRWIQDAYPTGRSMVITEEGFKRIFEIDMPEKRIALIEPEAYEILLKMNEGQPEEEPDA